MNEDQEAKTPSMISAASLGIGDEQSKAIQSASVFGTTLVTETGSLFRYIGRILGTAPQDAVGLVLGDPLRFVRAAIAAQYDERLTKILKARHVTDTQPVSPSLAIPLVRAAYDETRPELQQLWAALIASAMDPTRSGRIRLTFIDVLKRFDPLDALVLRERNQHTGTLDPNAVVFIASKLGVHGEEVQISVDNLKVLNCVFLETVSLTSFNVSPLGRALLRACE